MSIEGKARQGKERKATITLSCHAQGPQLLPSPVALGTFGSACLSCPCTNGCSTGTGLVFSDSSSRRGDGLNGRLATRRERRPVDQTHKPEPPPKRHRPRLLSNLKEPCGFHRNIASGPVRQPRCWGCCCCCCLPPPGSKFRHRPRSPTVCCPRAPIYLRRGDSAGEQNSTGMYVWM